MKRVNQIIRHQQYKVYYERIKACEKNRIFCVHDMVHFMDVARLAHIQNLEEGLEVDPEMIYAAAMLHDIGRFRQYEDGTPHEQASAELAGPILRECGFDESERGMIRSAILTHRSFEQSRKIRLNRILYDADKQSRNCICCEAEPECKWDPAKKNMIMKR